MSAERIEALFQEACDLDPDARAAFLEQRCERELRPEVERLLRHAALAPSGFLAGAPARPADLVELEIGSMVGPYRILERIGEGGFGSVYLAEQERPLRRLVAVKVVKLGMDTRRVVARFDAERQALALMSHPNIARVFDAGATARGLPYFVMEYVRGVPVTEYCDRERLDLRARLGLFMDACDAIGHAHQKGVIHRDIKPSNILVEVADGRPLVKVIDFGIAKSLGAASPGQTMMTEQGQLLGTPEYMSPEQADFSSADVDTRTDIYSLGVLLYGLLAGVAPVDAGAVRSGTPVERISRIRASLPATPSSRVRALGAAADEQARRRRTDPGALARKLSGDLDWITLKAMDKERSRRYASCSELAADLRRHLACEPVLAGPPGAAYRISKFVGRHRVGVAAALGVLVVLVAGLVGTSWQAVRATRAEAATARERDSARLEARKAVAVRTFLTEMLGDARPRNSRFGELTVHEALDRAAARLEAGSLADQPEVEEAVRSMLAHTYTELEDPRSALPHHEWVARYCAEHEGEESLKYADAIYWVGGTMAQVGRLTDARDLLARSVDIYRRRAPTNSRLVRPLITLADVHSRLGDYPRAEIMGLEALEELRRRGAADGQGAAMAMWQVAHARNRQGKVREAWRLFEEAAPIMEARFPLPSVHGIRFRRVYATDALIPQGRLEEAEAQLREFAGAARATIGAGHPESRATDRLLARLLLLRGRVEEARVLYEGLPARYEPDVSPRAMRALAADVGACLVAAGDPGAADALRARFGDPRPSEALRAGADACEGLVAAGRYAQAEGAARECEAAAAAALPDHWMRYFVMGVRGRALLGLGRTPDAEPLLFEGHAGMARCTDPRRMRLVRAWIADLYGSTGRAEEAARWRALAAELVPGVSPPTPDEPADAGTEPPAPVDPSVPGVP